MADHAKRTIWWRGGCEKLDPESGHYDRIVNHHTGTTVIAPGEAMPAVPAEVSAKLRDAGLIENADERPDTRHPHSIALDTFKREQEEIRAAMMIQQKTGRAPKSPGSSTQPAPST